MLNLKQALIALALLALAAACGFIPETRSWSEDVQLDDGSVITIERYVRFERSNSLAGDAPNATEQRATLRFTGALANLPAWDVPLMALVLYRDAQTNEWVVVATTGQCEIWDARGQPFPPYWEYRLSDGQWHERPLSDSSKGHATNLFIDYLGKSIDRHIGVSKKHALLSDPTLMEVYRRVVPDIRRYCMVSAR